MKADRSNPTQIVDPHAPRLLRLEMKDGDLGRGHFDAAAELTSLRTVRDILVTGDAAAGSARPTASTRPVRS